MVAIRHAVPRVGSSRAGTGVVGLLVWLLAGACMPATIEEPPVIDGPEPPAPYTVKPRQDAAPPRDATRAPPPTSIPDAGAADLQPAADAQPFGDVERRPTDGAPPPPPRPVDGAPCSGAKYEVCEGFETYADGAREVDYFIEQNCRAIAGCGTCRTSTPLAVSGAQARGGKQSLRFEKAPGDQTNTGGGYCGYRNEISGHSHPFADYGDHVWIGFSFFAETFWEEVYAADKVHVFQFKNEDRGGSGNQKGSLTSQNVGGTFKFVVAGLGQVTDVKRGAWNDVVLHLHYKTSGGKIEAWINGVHRSATVDFEPKQRCYVKFGTYGADVAAGTKHVGYYDNIRVLEDGSGANRFDDVDPARM